MLRLYRKWYLAQCHYPRMRVIQALYIYKVFLLWIPAFAGMTIQKKETINMFLRNLKNCDTFLAADNAILKEILHPDKQNIDIRYSLAHATVKTGQKTKPNGLTTTKVYYIIKGTGIMHINEDKKKVNKGCAIYIPPHATQCIENIGKSDLVFLCIVDPAWRK